MCNFELSISAVEQAYPISFSSYFAKELDQLRALEQEGLLKIDAEWLTVTLKGRLLIRNICMVFDRYLTAAKEAAVHPLRYSKTI
jgi:oxygen-independent coproporphyrinogen III oxidase